jgi:hypothetical protein
MAITTHPRNKNNILNKIKKVGDVIYEKPHTDSAARLSIIHSDHTDDQLPTNIPQSNPKVNGKNDKN